MFNVLSRGYIILRLHRSDSAAIITRSGSGSVVVAINDDKHKRSALDAKYRSSPACRRRHAGEHLRDYNRRASFGHLRLAIHAF